LWLRGLGERFNSPSGSGRSPATKRYLVNFRLKISPLAATNFRSFSGNETSNWGLPSGIVCACLPCKMEHVVCGCVVVALFSNYTSWQLGGLKQQGPCKLKVGGGGHAPPPPPGSTAYAAGSLLLHKSLTPSLSPHTHTAFNSNFLGKHGLASCPIYFLSPFRST